MNCFEFGQVGNFEFGVGDFWRGGLIFTGGFL
jgi:hypothetical protein